MRTGFLIIDKEFFDDLEEYIKLNAEAEEGKFNSVPDRIFKATITYQYFCAITGKDLTLQEIYQKHFCSHLVSFCNLQFDINLQFTIPLFSKTIAFLSFLLHSWYIKFCQKSFASTDS